MTLRPLSIVLTAAGCPGASTLIRMLRANGERDLRIHGVDTRPDAVGRFLCDGFETVPPGDDEAYAPALLAVCERRRPDVLFVQSSHEVGAVARHRADFEALGVAVPVASPQAVALCGDKAAAYEALAHAPVPRPRTLLPHSLDEFVAGCEELGYPASAVCFKPPVSKGSRGFRVLSARVDRVRQLLFERPVSRTMTLEEFVDVMRGVHPFPRLMLMEYVPGPEHTVDGLAADGELLLWQTKTREVVTTGVAMAFRTVHRPDLEDAARHVCRGLGLDWFVNVQFKGDALLEVNPRVSTFVYQEDLVLPYLGIKYALGEIDRDGLAAAQARVRPGRRTVRYYDQVFWDDPA